MAQPEQARESTHLDDVLYTAKTHTTGGRDEGTSRTDDGRLEVKFSKPGMVGTGTNPEQLFAAAWSACYLSAIKFLAGRKRITLSSDAAVDAEIQYGEAHGLHGIHGLAARFNVSLPGLDRQAAESLAEAAHQVCPYSRATHGNVEVATNVAV